MTEIIHREESYRNMGACFEVYKEVGPGFLEQVYHQCLKIEFHLRGIPFVSKKPLPFTYKGHQLEKGYEPDFICFDKIILEIKAVSDLADIHRAKVHQYLKSSGLQLGILVNFCHFPQLEHERIAL